MIQFSVQMYEMMVEKIDGSGCVKVASQGEQVVEIDWGGVEILFRFTPCEDAKRGGFRAAKVETFNAHGVLISNDFEADRLRRML